MYYIKNINNSNSNKNKYTLRIIYLGGINIYY